MCYLPFEDLKISRLVCRDWESQTSLLFRDRALITFTTKKQVREFTSEQSLIRSSIFANFRFGCSMKMKSEACVHFFQTFGSFVRSIHFENCDWTETGSMFRRLLEELLPILNELQIELTNMFPVNEIINSENYISTKLPNLRSLIIDFPVFDKFQCSIVGMNTFLYAFLINVPNLESIRHSDSPYHHCHPPSIFEESYFCKVLFEILVSSSEIKLRNLKTLNLLRKLSETQLQQLESKYFPLQTLHLSILYNTSGPTKAMCSLLSSLERTIVDLSIVFLNEAEPSYKLNFGKHLRKLKYLTLEGYKCSFDFVKELPSLKVLTVHDGRLYL